MISIGEALEIIKDNQVEPTVAYVSLEDSLGKVLAEDIKSKENLPRYTNSAMDGYAMKWEDLQQYPDILLQAVGESHAGEPFFEHINNGQAVKISTGAMLPEGTDTVVPIEEILEEQNSQIKLRTPVKKQHQHVRFVGEEIKESQTILKSGTLISPSEIALLASAGIFDVKVFLPPRVSVVLTGSELVNYDTVDIKPWEIRDSNGIMLQSVVKQSGAKLVSLSKTKDSLEDTIQSLKEAMSKSQIIFFSGGVSVGPKDYVKEAAEKLGFETLFWRIKQKPGKPMLFASNGDKLLFGFPGNPVSCLICYMYYAYPLIQKLQGKNFTWHKVKAKLGDKIENLSKRSIFMRISIKQQKCQKVSLDLVDGESIENILTVCPLKQQGSHMLSTLTQADGFILVEANQVYEKDSWVEFISFPWKINGVSYG